MTAGCAPNTTASCPSRTFYLHEKLLMRLKTAHIHDYFVHCISGNLVGGNSLDYFNEIRKRVKK